MSEKKYFVFDFYRPVYEKQDFSCGSDKLPLHNTLLSPCFYDLGCEY
jgi:hypothetical protein